MRVALFSHEKSEECAFTIKRSQEKIKINSSFCNVKSIGNLVVACTLLITGFSPAVISSDFLPNKEGSLIQHNLPESGRISQNFEALKFPKKKTSIERIQPIERKQSITVDGLIVQWHKTITTQSIPRLCCEP